MAFGAVGGIVAYELREVPGLTLTWMQAHPIETILIYFMIMFCVAWVRYTIDRRKVYDLGYEITKIGYELEDIKAQCRHDEIIAAIRSIGEKK